MATRREVMASGSIATGCILVGGAGASLPAERLMPRAIFDDRFAEARSFGGAMASRGAVSNGFAGDVTNFWHGVLRAEWTKAAMVLAGMTTPGTLFCLERWAWDADLRVVFRVDHRRKRDGAVEHHVATAVDLPALQGAVRAMGIDYAPRMADLIAAGAYPAACCASAAGIGASPDQPDPLVTWVIAPRSRA